MASSTSAANEQDIAGFLAGLGLTAPQVAGVLGNIQQESGFQPLAPAFDVNGPSGGIVQWHNSRLSSLESYVKGEGGTGVGTVDQELGYLGHELAPGGSYNSALRAVQATTTPAAAAAAWNKSYEGGTDPGGVREANANAIYNAGIGASSTSAGDPNISEASFIGNLPGALGHLLNHPLADVPIVGSYLDSADPNATVTGAVGSVAGSAWSAAAPAVYRITFGLIAGALVVGGLYLAAKPAVHSVAGKVSDTAGTVGKFAAL